MVKISLDNGVTWAQAINTVGQNSFSHTAELKGSNTLQVRVEDAAGNAGSVKKQAYVLDTAAAAAPGVVLDVDSGSSGSDKISSASSLNVSGVEDTATWQYSLDAGKNWLSGTGRSITGLTGDGAKSVIVRQTDAAGNISADSVSYVFTFDTTAPTLSTTSLPALVLGTALAGTAGDSAGETIILKVTFDGAVNGLTSGNDNTIFKAGVTGVSAAWSGADGSSFRTLTYTITAGQNGQATIDEAALKTALLAGIQDTAGNAFAYSSVIANIDSTALPVIDTIAPQKPATPTVISSVASGISTAEGTAGVAVTVSLADTGAVVGDTLKLWINGSTTAMDRVLVQSEIDQGRYAFLVLGSALNVNASNTFKSSVVDNAGNSSAQSTNALSVYYDTVASVFSSPATQTVSGGILVDTISAVYDANSTDRGYNNDYGITYSLSGGVDSNLFKIDSDGLVTFKTSTSYTAPTDAGRNNVYDIIVRATDLAGNFTDKDVAITVDSSSSIYADAFATISLGNLIGKVTVNDGHNYFFWDKSGDGLASSSDMMSTDTARNSLGIGVYTKDGIKLNLQLPEFGATLNWIESVAPLNLPMGYGILSGQPTLPNNDKNPLYIGLASIWDACSNPESNSPPGLPLGWGKGYYASSTVSHSGYLQLELYIGLFGASFSTTDAYVAVELL